MTRKIAVLIVLATALVVLPAGLAHADAGTHASCVGIESSHVAPAGTSDEFPNGRPQMNEVLRDAFPGTPLGALIAPFAKLHAGSHQGCDEASE
jgi:hypothetical protein